MEVQVKYDNLIDRQVKAKEQEAKGLRMLHDDFDSNWNRGDEPHGTMTFTDTLPPIAELKLTRNLEAEIDELKARLDSLEVSK